jgi:ribosomal-protein-alanine N-acetyltransferase
MILSDRLFFDGGYLSTLHPEQVSDSYVNGLNNPLINRYLEVRKVRQSLQSVQNFILFNLSSSSSFLLGIWATDHDKLVGTLRIHDLDLEQLHCFLGLCIFDLSCHGVGIGSKSVSRICQYLRLQYTGITVEAHVHTDNIPSLSLFRRCGFTLISDVSKLYPGDSEASTYSVFQF